MGVRFRRWTALSST